MEEEGRLSQDKESSKAFLNVRFPVLSTLEVRYVLIFFFLFLSVLGGKKCPCILKRQRNYSYLRSVNTEFLPL